MKVLITGGAGFLGYHIANDLADKSATFVLYDKVPAELHEFPAGTVGEVGDICDAARLREVFERHRPDAVVHGAAALPLCSPQEIHDVNIGGTRNVLQACLDAGVQRVVHISSTAVYGVPDKHPLFETDPMVGVGPYGITKIAAEGLCAEFRAKGLNVMVIRPKTFIGTARLGVFQILYDWVESGTKVPVIGPGTNRYQLLEVEDLVQAIELGLSGPADAVNDVFNVGASVFATVNEDVGALCAYAGNGSCVLHTWAPGVKAVLRVLELLRLSPLYKWVYGTADTDSFVSTEKIVALGWQPKYSNAEALIRSYQWYLDHKAELAGATGTTHRVAWKQGALGWIKRCLKVKRPS